MDYYESMLFTLPLVVDKNNQQIVIISIFKDRVKKEMFTETKKNESAFKLQCSIKYS